MRTTSTTLGVDIGFFSMPTRSIASATYATSSDQNMNDGNVNQTNLKAAQAAFKISNPKDSIKTCDYAENAICKIIINQTMVFFHQQRF
jgi:hypothetical protein